VQQYEDALKIDPNYAEARGNLARAFAAGGRFTEAVREVEAAMKLSPAEPLASVLREQLRVYRAELK